jgi:hypothetical protein
MSYELKRFGRKSRDVIKILFWNLLGETEEHNVNPVFRTSSNQMPPAKERTCRAGYDVAWKETRET